MHVGVGAADHFLDVLQEDLNRYIMPLIEKDVDMMNLNRNVNQQHIDMYVKNQLKMINCEIIVMSMDNFVELHIGNAT